MKIFNNSIHSNAKIIQILLYVRLGVLVRLLGFIVTRINLFRYRDRLNRKLEIGPGENRIEGFETVNILFGSNVDYVMDVSRTKMPFKEGSFETVYASHVFEHFPWYKQVQILEECYRILTPNGHLEIWVPDGLKLAKGLIATEEEGIDSSVDDGWYRLNPDKDPHIWVSARIYSYGDGTGKSDNPNWHKTLFTPKMLEKLLLKAGFKTVEPLNREEVRGYDHGWINLGVRGIK